MNEVILREYCAHDVPALSALWMSAFDDTPGFVAGFFEALPDIGLGVAAELDGRIVGAAYAITALSLVAPEEGEACPTAYIYGVATAAEWRSQGIGARLVNEAAARARARGARVICTLPAEAGLYDWYARTAGLSMRLRRAERHMPCPASGALPPVRQISAGEYLARREALLAGRAHVRLSTAAMDFQARLLREYGGGLFTLASGGIAAAYLDGGRALIRELICPDAASADEEAACVCAAIGADGAVIYSAAPEGEAYIAADAPLPADLVWNLSFD